MVLLLILTDETMNKHNFDKQAEQEALALRKQGRPERRPFVRLRTKTYSQTEFDKLFRRK